MGIENKLQAIYTEKGYDLTCDNRNYFTKSLNKALCNKSVTFKLCKKGFIYIRESDGFEYNLKIQIDGKGKIWKLKRLDPESICECFAKVAKMDHVKESIHIHEDAYKCEKCGGRGIIPCFMHICQGVCFDCLGIGYKFHSGNW